MIRPFAALVALALAAAPAISQAAKMSSIKKGAKVSIHYTLTVDKQVVDSSTGKEPLTFVQGGGQIIPGLEEQLQGLKRGDKRRITVQPDKGYGHISGEAITTVPRSTFQGVKDLKPGGYVTGQQANGQMIRAKVVSVDKKHVVLDLNHPLAGKVLNFDVEVVDIQTPN